MLAKSLLRLSLTTRNLAVKRQQIFFYHLSKVEHISDKSNLQPNLSTDADSLLVDLDNQNPKKVIEWMEKNKNVINGSHVVTAVTSLFKSYRKIVTENKYDDSEKNSITDFSKQIISLTESNVNKLTGSQAVEILNLLNRLNVSESDEATQSVLNHILNSLNDLSIVNYGILSSTLKKMPKTELNKRINSELTKKFIKAVSLTFDENNIDQIVHGFSFVSLNLKNLKMLDIFIKRLHNCKEDFSIKNSIILLEALCTMKLYPLGWENILNRVLKYLVKRIDFLNTSQTNYIIYLLSQKLKETRMNEFYDPVVFDKLCQKIIDDDMGFESALSAIKCTSIVRHYNKEILNYASAAYFEKTTLIGETIEYKVGKLLVLLSGLAIANYKPMFWKEMQESVLDYNKLLNYDYKTLCIITLNNVCLDYYPIPCLEKLFDGNYDFTGQPYLHWSFCKIYQKLMIVPNYNGPMPTDAQIESLIDLQKRTHVKRDWHTYKMLPYLEKGMGGSAYIKTHLFTRNFNLIEHVVAFDKNNKPIPISSETSTNVLSRGSKDVEFVEDLQVPPESQIVLILYLPNYWYFRNVNQLLTQHQISMDSIKKMSYSVVIMNENIWLSIPKNQKTDYLMSEINSKIESKNKNQ